jgi:nucleotide-binding universal stress UspA family protein
MPEPSTSKMLYILTAENSAKALGIQKAIQSVGTPGRLVLAYIHDPQHEEQLRESLSSGAFVGLKQIDDVTDAAWKTTEANGIKSLEEAKKSAEEAGLSVSVEIMHGDLVERILELSQKHSPDHVMICHSQNGFLGRLFPSKMQKKLKRRLSIPFVTVTSD